MKKLTMTLIAAALAIPAMAQTSAPAKVGVINVRKVFLESNAGKAATDRIQKLDKQKAEGAKKLAEELKALETEITTKRVSLSEDKLTALKKQFDEKKIEYQRFGQDAERELTEMNQKSLAEIEKQLMPIITQVGKEMGFAAIFDRVDSGMVYASDAIDITDIVTKRFNEAGTAAAPAAAKK